MATMLVGCNTNVRVTAKPGATNLSGSYRYVGIDRARPENFPNPLINWPAHVSDGTRYSVELQNIDLPLLGSSVGVAARWASLNEPTTPVVGVPEPGMVGLLVWAC